MKSKVTIFSSTESSGVAKKIQRELQHNAEPTVWSQGVFKPSQISIHSILENFSNAEFAVVILTPDDDVEARGQSYKTARGNVILELGLSIGILGLENTFLVTPKNIDIKKITDLEGVTPCVYGHERSDGNLQAALGPVYDEIMDAINERGIGSFKERLIELLNEINPDIILWHKSGKKLVSITLTQRNQSKLDGLSMSRSQYFNRFINIFRANGSFVNGVGGTIGNILRDKAGGMMNGFDLMLKPELFN